MNDCINNRFPNRFWWVFQCLKTFSRPDLNVRHNFSYMVNCCMYDLVCGCFDSHLLCEMISFRIVLLRFIPSDFDCTLPRDHGTWHRMEQQCGRRSDVSISVLQEILV